MPINKCALNRPASRALLLALPLLALPLCAARAGANEIAIAGSVHCDAFGDRSSDPAWTQPVNFFFLAGKLRAIRYTQTHPGREVYDGSVGGDGFVRVSGTGAYNEWGPPWQTYFQGKLADRGETILSGEMRVPATGRRRPCSISLRTGATALRDQAGRPRIAAAKPAPQIATPQPSPKPAPSAAPQSPAPSSSSSSTTIVVAAVSSSTAHVVTNENAAVVNKRIADLKAQIDVLSKVLAEQTDLQKTATADLRASVDKAIEAVNARLETLKGEYTAMDASFGVYLTSVTPNDRDLYLTARKASEIYPKIPYYIPGTNETGEFWVEPTVSDRGELRFGFKFVDANASIDTVRETIDMSLPEIEDAQKALFKLQAWSEVAHQQKLRKSYEKRVTCFPVSECPPDGERVDGKASTEITFDVYEDGSTAGSIQRDKGRFVENYNVSIESAMLLQAYLAHVINVATKEFDSGTQDKKALDDLFR
jgi:hypothetical protein